MLHDAYWSWNDVLNSVPWADRGANIPEALTEAIVCLCTNSKLIRGGKGDILLPNSKIGEVKATSKASNDLTSFSPSEHFDNLYFVMADPNNNTVYSVYDLNIGRKMIEKVQVSSTQTFKDQADAGRRPRFSIIDTFIIKKSLQPTWKVDIKKHTIQS